MEWLLALGGAVAAVFLVGWLFSIWSEFKLQRTLNDPDYWRSKDIHDLEAALAITPHQYMEDETMSVHEAISLALASRRREVENAVIERRMAGYVASAAQYESENNLVLKDK